mmetsp:Transcript_70321/g.139406  ORF Transcript_70321/g.139406 Transcript_70321/m.139406 type:complete len:129 (-) Transcript_70321:170-556(-)
MGCVTCSCDDSSNIVEEIPISKADLKPVPALSVFKKSPSNVEYEEFELHVHKNEPSELLGLQLMQLGELPELQIIQIMPEGAALRCGRAAALKDVIIQVNGLSTCAAEMAAEIGRSRDVILLMKRNVV